MSIFCIDQKIIFFRQQPKWREDDLHKLVSAITMTQAKEFYVLNEAFLSGFLDEGQLKRLREVGVRIRFIVRVEVRK